MENIYNTEVSAFINKAMFDLDADEDDYADIGEFISAYGLGIFEDLVERTQSLAERTGHTFLAKFASVFDYDIEEESYDTMQTAQILDYQVPEDIDELARFIETNVESFEHIDGIAAADYQGVIDDWHAAAEMLAYFANESIGEIMKREDKNYNAEREAVRNEAVEFSNHMSEIDDPDELQDKYSYFEKMGIRYGLTDEFVENCIV